jgi:HptB-dependent secretion and biofilm anti anti-sigma factor
MKTDIVRNGDQVTLRLAGTFDMHAHVGFRQAYRKLLEEGGCQRLTLDMRHVDYIDSSGLGMLLLLQGEAEDATRDIVIEGCQPFVKQVLTTANFHKMYRIT